MIEQEITLLTNGRISFQKCGNGLQFGYSKNRGVYSIKVKTSGEWNGLTIRAFWHIPDIKEPITSLLVDNVIRVPALVTSYKGEGRIVFEGSDGAKTVTSADVRYYVNKNSGTCDGTIPEPGTPAWQELVGAVKKYSDTAVEAKESAKKSADEAKASELAAKGSEDKAKTSEIISTANTAEVAKNLETVRDIKAEIDILDANVSANAASSNENANNARISAEAAKQSETNAALSEASALESKNASAATLQELKDGIASGNFKGEKGDKGDTGPQGPQGEQGPDNLVIITATANATVQGEYIPDTTYSNALADIQANKAVMIKLDNVPGRYYIPYSSSNAEILASAGTVSGSNQSIELYLIKWTAQTNTITLTGTKEGCIADGGTAGQVLVKKSDESFDTEWKLQYIIVRSNQAFNMSNLLEQYNTGTLIYLYRENTKRLYTIIYATTTFLSGISDIVHDSNTNRISVLKCTIQGDNILYYSETALFLPSGGKTGQILAKKSNTGGDTEWIDPPSVEIPKDYPQIREDVSKLKEDTAALQARQNILVGTETGNPLSVDDAFSAPLCGLTVYGRSTQDGTPTPDAPVPIVSAGDSGSVTVKVTGKNLLYLPDIEERTVGGVTYSVKNGVIKIKGTSSGRSVLLVQGIKLFVGTWFFDPNPVKGTESLNCYLDLTNTINRGFSLASGAASKPVKLSEVEVKYPFRLNIINAAGSVIDMEWKPQMLLSDKLLPYSPYREQLLTLPTPNGLPGIPVTSGGNYTDPQGQQWVCDEVDLERGVRVQRVKAVDLSTCAITGTTELAATKRLSILLPLKGRDYKTESLCNKLQFLVSFTEDRPHFYVDTTNAQVFIPIGAKNPGEGEYFLSYVLATPIETPLTPAEIAAYKALTAYGPDTVVQAGDGAGVKLDYQRDVNIAIKRIEDAVASMTTT